MVFVDPVTRQNRDNEIDPVSYTREGRDWPVEDIRGKKTYNTETLINQAHQVGLVGTSSEMLHVDFEERRAVVRVTVSLADGRVFQGIGDASPDSIGNDKVADAFVRMAETRALGRALRFALNAGAMAADEMGSESSSGSSRSSSKSRTSYKDKAKKSEPKADDDWS